MRCALTLRATARGMESDAVQVSAATAAGEIALVVHPSAVSQQITVTATRSSLDLPATANTVYVIGAEELKDYPAFALDDKLRQQAGFELFRRSSSRVQNPTSQGDQKLRGLGSTAVSRTLVLEDSVPMNDPFGGWIHWDEIPAEAIDAVTIATGVGSAPVWVERAGRRGGCGAGAAFDCARGCECGGRRAGTLRWL